jgi:hypothetical protein
VTRTRIRTLVVLTTGVVALIAGCGTPQAGSAAVVGNRRISVSDLQSATVDAQAFVGPSVAVTQRQVLYLLAASPFIEQIADRFGVGVSPDDARAAMAQSVPHPSSSGLAVIQANEALLAVQQLGNQEASLANTAITQGLVADKFTVNPRYGSFDTAIGRIAPIQPDWQPTTTPSASGSAVTPSP